MLKGEEEQGYYLSSIYSTAGYAPLNAEPLFSHSPANWLPDSRPKRHPLQGPEDERGMGIRNLLASTYYLAAVMLAVLVVLAVTLLRRDWQQQAQAADLSLTSVRGYDTISTSAAENDDDVDAGMLGRERSGSTLFRKDYLTEKDDRFVTEEGLQRRRPPPSLPTTVAPQPLPLPLSTCEIPPGGFKGWGHGTVTQVTPPVRANCSRILAGDRVEIDRVNKTLSNWTNAVTDEDFYQQLQNCTWLRNSFTDNLYNSEVEREFPIAFTMVVHNSPQQVLRLLRLLYRPQNAYCIHYDIKSKFSSFFESIASCFDNVMIASKLERVVWGHYTILQAQLNCMSDLLRYRETRVSKWKYIVNLCGKELPLLTNREMVRKMMKLNGASSIIAESCAKRKQIIERRLRHPVYLNENKTALILYLSLKLGKPPFDISVYHKSSSYNALSFDFANYVTTNKYAKDVYEFFKKTKNAEEHYYATLYKIPGVPGGFDGKIPARDYFEIAGSYWTKSNTLGKQHACQGLEIHQVCIVAVGDLQEVAGQTGKLFHNKYFMENDHVVMNCMEERMVDRNRLEYEQECS